MNRSPFGARRLLATIAIMACFLTFSTPAVASPQSDNARDQAKQILSEKKYGREGKKPLAKDVDRLSRWLGGKKSVSKVKKNTDKQIQQQNGQSPPSFSPPGLGGLGAAATIFLYVLLAILVGGIGFLIFKAIRSRDKTKKEEQKNEEIVDIDWSDEEKVLENVTDADHLEKLSDQAELAGQLDLALRYRFRAGLLRLNDIDVISFHPSVTNAQWQLIINNEGFNTLTRDFNDVTYGQRTCDVNHLSRARSEWANLVNTRKKTKHESTSL